MFNVISRDTEFALQVGRYSISWTSKTPESGSGLGLVEHSTK